MEVAKLTRTADMFFSGSVHMLLCVHPRGQDKHIRQLQDTFEKFDAQNKGHLSVRELGA